ncbi:PQ loop repeat-containing protein 2 [Tritrichomonas musculus]|uniref:PQ loop repeat-containing protein 2 n=1 Tax=Tritrichomonas musculus TaxID=1915356 RepID=A0ABR2HXX6_9EUKA
MGDSCEGGIKWIEKVFGDCVVTPRDKISFGIGMISNCLWLVCSTPQIYHNYVTKEVEGFSPFYFILIVTADTFSLLGAIFTHGLASQIVTGFIYITLDIILLTQFSIYGCMKNRCQKNKNKNIIEPSVENIEIHSDSDQINTSNQNGDSGNEVSMTTGLLAAALPSLGSSIDYSAPYKGEYLFGSVSGWIGTTIYVSSRIFQLKKNLEQEIVKDFSIIYVALLITANATYSISVFLRSLEEAYLWKQTPFIIGSLVPMTFDCITMGQIIYGKRKMKKMKEHGLVEPFCDPNYEN